MNLKMIFGKEIVDLSDLEKKITPDTSVLSGLKSEMTEDKTNSIGQNWEAVDKFVEGEQWINITIKKPLTAYNSNGNPVYIWDNSKYTQQDGKPMKIINITKSKLETIQAQHAEIEPMPFAEGVNDYYHDDELSHKINLLLNQLFKEENNFDVLYEDIVYNAYEFGHSIVQLEWDADKAITNTPLKFRTVHPDKILVDPSAREINEADYILHTVRMKYYQLKDSFNYEPNYVQEAFKGTAEPKATDIVEIESWYFRFRIKGKEYWLNVPIYNNQWLKKIKNKTVQPIEASLFKRLPFVLFRLKVGDRWNGEGIVPDMIQSQIDYNTTASMQEWNWRRYIDPTSIGGDKTKLSNAQKPNGHYELEQGEAAPQFMKTDIITGAEFQAKEQMIIQEIDGITGIPSNMGGQPQANTYVTSNKMLQTMAQQSQIKPKMYEGHFFASIAEMAEKSLDMCADYSRATSIFDPAAKDTDSMTGEESFGAMIEVTAKDIRDSRYKLNIKTKDENLMTKEAKFEIIQSIMQYAKLQELYHPYFIAQMINNAMPGLIPDEVVKALREDYKKTGSPLMAQPPAGGQPPNGQMPPTGGPTPPQTGGEIPPTGAPGEQPPNEAQQDIPEDYFNKQVEGMRTDFARVFGGKQGDKFLDDFIKHAMDSGSDRALTLYDLKSFYNKMMNKPEEG